MSTISSMDSDLEEEEETTLLELNEITSGVGTTNINNPAPEGYKGVTGCPKEMA